MYVDTTSIASSFLLLLQLSQIGYAQGMGDLLAPLLALFDGRNGESSQCSRNKSKSQKKPPEQNIEDEDALAFACFEAFLQSQVCLKISLSFIFYVLPRRFSISPFVMPLTVFTRKMNWKKN